MVIVTIIVHVVFLCGLLSVGALLVYVISVNSASTDCVWIVIMAVVGLGLGGLLLLLLGPVVTDQSPLWWKILAAVVLSGTGLLSGLLLATFYQEGSAVGQCLIGATLAFLFTQILYYWGAWFQTDVEHVFADAESALFILFALSAFALKSANDG